MNRVRGEMERSLREYSIPALAEIPASANAADVVTRRAAEQPSAVMLRRKAADGTWDDVTASQFSDEVHALAKGFIAAGVQAGDRVALMSHTRYEWTLIDYALWTAGAIVVPIYETSSAEQAEWILANSEARAVIAETDAFAAMIGGARDRLPVLEHLWLLESDLPALTAAGAEVSAETVAERAGSRGAADIATVIYTSGTTGRPKGCELTHGNLLAAVRNAFIGPLSAIHAAEAASTLLFLPLAHVFARVIEVGTLEAGIVLGHCSDMANLLPELASFKPTFVLAVPRVFEKVYNGAEAKALAEGKGKIFARATQTAVLYSHGLDSGRPGLRLRAEHALFDRLVYGKLRAALGGQAEFAISGGAALAPRLGHFFRGIGVSILEGYGLTETTAPVSVNRPERQKIGSVGQPIPGVAVRIADDGRCSPGAPDLPRLLARRDGDQGRLHRRRLVRHRRHRRARRRGFLPSPAGRRRSSSPRAARTSRPAVLEDRMRAHA